MNKVRKSLSAMLLVSFLAAPSCVAKQLVKKNFDLRTLAKILLSSGMTFGGICGSKKLYNHFQENEDRWSNDDLNTTCDSIVNEAFTDDKPAPIAPFNSSSVMDQSYNIEFARFIGLNEGDIKCIKECFDVSMGISKNVVSKNFEAYVKPFIDLKKAPMPKDLKDTLVNEMAVTLIMMDSTGFPKDEPFLFPFTLFRIYGLTNVFKAMKDYGRDKFEINVDFSKCNRTYTVDDRVDHVIYSVTQTENVDLVYGSFAGLDSSVSKKDCISGGPGFKNFETALNIYYPLLGKIWKYHITEANESKECRFYKAARLAGNGCCTRLFADHPLTLPLLRYVKSFVIHFKPNSFRILFQKDYNDKDKKAVYNMNVPYTDLSFKS